MQAEAQRQQSGQLTPGQQVAQDRLQFDQDKDKRAQQVQHANVLGRIAGSMEGLSPVQQQVRMQQAYAYAEQYGMSTEGWKQPGDPGFDAWAKGVAIKADEAVEAAKDYTLGRTRFSGGTNKPIASVSKDDSGGGAPKSMTEGNAYNALLEERTFIDAGQEVPTDVKRRATVARHVLNTKHYRTGPDGEVLSYVPGVPEGFGGKVSQAATGQAVAEQGATEKGGLTTEIPAEPDVDVGKPLSVMKKIVGLMNAGENITGVVGTAKRLGGGLARQALGKEGAAAIGMGSSSAKDLHRLFETLQAQMGPIILNEKRLSETERQRLMNIVGSVTPLLDEQDLRSGLADLFDFLMEYNK